MDSSYFTASLYIFSSLIQSDAAILGLGAIFIIYRLQALDSSYQNSVAIGEGGRNTTIAQTIHQLALSTSYPEKAAILINFVGSPYMATLRTVAYISLWKVTLTRRSLPLLASLAVHSSACAVLLYFTPILSQSALTSLYAWAMATVASFVFLMAYIVI